MLIETKIDCRLYLDPETLCNMVEEMGLTDGNVYMLMGCLVANMIRPEGEECGMLLPPDTPSTTMQAIEALHKHGYAACGDVEGGKLVALMQHKFSIDLVKRMPTKNGRRKR